MTDREPDMAMEPLARHAPGTLDEQGRIMCTAARSRERGPCHAPAVTGMDRCRNHLGFTVEEARRQVQEAIGVLAAQALGIGWELLLSKDTPPAVRATLVRDLLDRAGHGATSRVLVSTDLTEPAARAAEAAGVRDELEERRQRQTG